MKKRKKKKEYNIYFLLYVCLVYERQKRKINVLIREEGRRKEGAYMNHKRHVS